MESVGIYLVISESDSEIYVVDHDDECECEYNDDLEIVWLCKKDTCPN